MEEHRVVKMSWAKKLIHPEFPAREAELEGFPRGYPRVHTKFQARLSQVRDTKKRKKKTNQQQQQEKKNPKEKGFL